MLVLVDDQAIGLDCKNELTQRPDHHRENDFPLGVEEGDHLGPHAQRICGQEHHGDEEVELGRECAHNLDEGLPPRVTHVVPRQHESQQRQEKEPQKHELPEVLQA